MTRRRGGWRDRSRAKHRRSHRSRSRSVRQQQSQRRRRRRAAGHPHHRLRGSCERCPSPQTRSRTNCLPQRARAVRFFSSRLAIARRWGWSTAAPSCGGTARLIAGSRRGARRSLTRSGSLKSMFWAAKSHFGRSVGTLGISFLRSRKARVGGIERAFLSASRPFTTPSKREFTYSANLASQHTYSTTCSFLSLPAY